MSILTRPIIYLLVCMVLISCGKEAPPKNMVRPVKAMKVGDTIGITGRPFPGKAKATEETYLSFDVPGTLIERPVNIGDSVEKGQLIARLDPRDYQANLKAARAAHKQSRHDFARAKELIKKDFISKVNYDLLEAKVDIAEANVAIARKALSDSVIKAPYAGRIPSLYVENYQAVLAKQRIARLLDTSKIEMIIHIPESLISYAPYVKNFRVKFDAFPGKEVPATIHEVSNEASATTRTYPVTLIMDQPQDFNIKPGMAGTARGERDMPEAEKTEQGFEIPLSATFSPYNTNDTYVWLIDEDSLTVSLHQVTTAELTANGIKVTKGIKTGDWLVTAGVHYLEKGQEVKIMTSFPLLKPGKGEK